MSGQEDCFDILRESQTKKQVVYRIHNDKKEDKRTKLKNKQGVKNTESEEDLQGRRKCTQHNKKGYYEEISLEIKAKKYWNTFDINYFKYTDVDNLTKILNLIRECDKPYYFLQDEYNLNNRLLSYKNNLIFEEYPKIKSRQPSIKTLFESDGNESYVGVYQLGDPNQVGRVQVGESIISLAMTGKAQVDSLLLQHNSNQNQTELDKEINLWENHLERVQNDNLIEIQKLKTLLEIPQIKIIINEADIELMKQKLYWSTIMKLFIQGHKDKSSGIFDFYNISGKESDIEQAYKSKKTVKKFQTDCKICFCSSNCQNNIVVYCDICNTSFHIICYGLKDIPKSEKYYCEVCTQFKLTGSSERPNCKICEKKYFPMKKMDNHYYHVTCLVLNNFVQFSNSGIQLRKNINFKTISNIVVESEIRYGSCYFCQSNHGFRFECDCQNCNVSFHPICGYLNGCIFNMRRNSKISNNLQVNAYCSNHNKSRNQTQQVYYRRYVCDYKKTASYSLQQFQQIYKRQMLTYDLNNHKKQKFEQHNILQVSKVMKDLKGKMNNSKIKIGGKVKTEVSKLMKNYSKQVIQN